MTKFDSVQISHRGKEKGSSYTTAELRKNMAIFKATGQHPELERRAEEAAATTSAGLPRADANRPHVYMDLTADSESLGTIVAEVFEDIAPSASREFVLRCTGSGKGRGGKEVSYQGTEFFRIVDSVRLDGGPPGKEGGVKVEESRRLTHSEAGIISLFPDSAQFTITLGPASHLDGKQQVVGRVVRGNKILAALSDAEVDGEFFPEKKTVVAACGTTTIGAADAPGGVLQMAAELRMERAQSEAERAARMKAETKEETRARLDREAAEQAEQLKRSVADGLVQANKKQKTTETAFQRGGMMDELLGDISDMSSSDDEE
jgi:cyclophilin family peptidyl-prolyl cis-trans isomerase